LVLDGEAIGVGGARRVGQPLKAACGIVGVFQLEGLVVMGGQNLAGSAFGACGIAVFAAVAGLVLLKRALGNDALALFRPRGAEILVNRLLFDRDTREREAWVRRGRVEQR
jgi:hypothetical protein